jgi:hypothetical protein
MDANGIENEKLNEKDASETHAYTPGLKIKRYTRIEKIKKLPVPGEVLVKIGDKVNFETIIARTKIPGPPHFVNVATSLNIENHEITEFMTKKEGDEVKKDETIAEMKLLFGLLKNTAKSTVDGYVEIISPETGRVTIREPDIPVEVKSNIKGNVIEILPREGAIIQTYGAYLQGIIGIGGETNGKLQLLEIPQDETITLSKQILPEHKDKILCINSTLNLEILKAARQNGVVGIISGGIEYDELTKFMGEEIGVAITGEEKLGLTVVVTEGFGDILMSERAYNLLKDLEGKRIAINGTTQIRAGVLRPEIICPIDEKANNLEKSDDEILSGMKPGTPIRVIQSPFFGMHGIIRSLPIALKEIETESDVRVVEVELDDSSIVIIPRANIELIEE